MLGELDSADTILVFRFNASGEDLQSKYGGSNLNETDFENINRVKTEEVGECSSCGGAGSGVKREYFYLQIIHGTPDDNEVTDSSSHLPTVSLSR